MDWFRWHHGSVTDPKFQLVAKRAGASVAEVIAVWAYILEHASQAAERGDFDGLDCEAVDLALGMHDGLTGRIIEQLGNRGLISGNRVAAWDKRQPKREDDTANDRKRRQREREHELAMAALSRTSHDASRDVTQCHAREEEKRLDKKDQKQEHEQQPPIAAQSGGRFAEFWIVYPNKKGRANAEKAWKRKKLDAIADEIIADVRQRIASDRDWLRGYIPHGSTYVNAEGWRDGMPTAPAPTQSKQMLGLQNLYNALTPNQGFDNDADTRLVLDFNP